ncbi:MAG: EFR1 family ferrodoxin [Spirochaetia bacterium]
MKVGILYFTGTGVTGYVARSLAAGLEKEGFRVELVRFKKGIFFDPSRYDIIGFGAPTYSFFPPRIFYRFLKNLPMSGEEGGRDGRGKPFFLFNTSHHMPGITLRAMFRVLTCKGWTLAAPPLLVKGVNNIRAWRFSKDRPPPRDTLRGLPGIDRLVDRLLSAGRYESAAAGKDTALQKRPGLALFTALFSWDWEMALVEGIGKRVDEEACTRCGRCAEEFCPSGAILIDSDSGYPRIRNLLCVGCSGCVNLCPEEAIVTFSGSKKHPLTKFREYL